MNNYKIAVIGLGYVGLPLAVEFAKKYLTVGFDINESRISELNSGNDKTLEIEKSLLDTLLIRDINNPTSSGLYCTTNVNDISECNIYIVTVPTPIDRYNKPDLTPLHKASRSLSRLLKKGDIVIYESTVYPGATEEECVPILCEESQLIYNTDFFVGYSPERINPGDKEHTVARILKVTSGSTPEISEIIDHLYQSIITAGTFKASSIKVAEAAKVIENTQRDINIAFVNELSKIFNLLGIDTAEVLEAAGTKWNFLKFKPGLVGGHCIGVDPYYLAQKSQEIGYHPEIILAGRRVNDDMGRFIATETIRLMIKKDIKVKNAAVLILGFTFKENCPDVRNTKVIDIVKELNNFEINTTLYDPLADPVEVEKEYQVKMFKSIPVNQYDAIILAVSHKEFQNIDIDVLLKENSVVYDVKGAFSKDKVDGRL